MSPTIWITTLILGLLFGAITTKKRTGSVMPEDRHDFFHFYVIHFMISFFIGLMIWFFIGLYIINSYDKTKVQLKKENLELIPNKENHYHVGIGYIDEEFKYYSFKKIKDTVTTMFTFPINTELVYDLEENESPYLVEKVEVSDTSTWIWKSENERWFAGPNLIYNHVNWELHINKEFNLEHNFEIYFNLK